MKKIIAILLAAVLLVSLSAAAFAEDRTETYSEVGVTLSYPEEFFSAEGYFEPYPAGDVDGGITMLGFLYCAMPEEELNALMMKESLTEEEETALVQSQCFMLYLLSIDGNGSAEDIAAAFDTEAVNAENMTEVGRAEDVVFYALEMPEETAAYLDGIDPVYAAEFKTLYDGLMEVLKKGEYFAPIPEGAEMIGKSWSFETTDLDGNPVKSEELFAENDVTMVNVWATWCGPCRGELKELGEMSRRYEGKGVAVVGLCTDADTEAETCRSLLEENNVDYLTLQPFAELYNSVEIGAFPTSFFVGRNGEILAAPFVGAPPEMSAYEEIIDSLLESAAADEAEPAAVRENTEGVYRVIVTDSEGNPVPGATVQFCSDSACMMGKTDDTGTAVYEVEEGSYTVHILKVPEGYEACSEEFTTADSFCDVSVVLEKAA